MAFVQSGLLIECLCFPKCLFWILTKDRMVFWSGVFGKCSGSILTNRTIALRIEFPGSSLVHALLWSFGQKMANTNHEIGQCLDLNYQASRNVRKESMRFLSHSVYGILFKQSKQTKLTKRLCFFLKWLLSWHSWQPIRCHHILSL